jgi:hypothetical protein
MQINANSSKHLGTTDGSFLDPFLTTLNRTTGQRIARTMGPQALRMNLNTLQRHGVFEDVAMVHVSGRLKPAILRVERCWCKLACRAFLVSHACGLLFD